MKRLLTLILALLLLAGCGTKEVPVEEEPEETVTAETVTEETEVHTFGAFSAQTLDGETLTEAIFEEADLTVVNLWATYCDPCKSEMPVLGMLDNELENVQVLGIVLDSTDQNGNPDPAQVELAIDLMEEAEADYTNLILNMELAMLGVASVASVPATLFVDAEGNLVGQGFYGALNETQWRETIAERLEMAQ